MPYVLSDLIILSYLFFFQAEDGIRDIGVTGVQTCALPICGVELERGLGGDDGVGAVVRRGGQGVRRLALRVGQRQRPADQRDPKHDGEGGEGRAQRTRGEAPEAQACHRLITSSTIRPSARWMTRSASSAARGSWVTITIVWPSSSTASRMRVRTSLPDLESRLPVGSSASRTVGSVM